MGEIAITKTASLRLLREADAEELHALIETNCDHLAPWLAWAAGHTHADTVEFIAKTRAQVVANDGFQTAIVIGAEIAGVIGFHSIDWVNRSTSIGYWLSEGWQGQGLMTTAARALSDHAFSVWDLNRVEIEAAAGNSRSRAIPERLGYHEEGTLREAERIGDRYLDSVLYAVLASEWVASGQAGAPGLTPPFGSRP
jgi:ribosomal-protein-serine acetyltransferase